MYTKIQDGCRQSVGECTVAANQGLTFEGTDLKNVTETGNSVIKDKM